MEAIPQTWKIKAKEKKTFKEGFRQTKELVHYKPNSQQNEQAAKTMGEDICKFSD